MIRRICTIGVLGMASLLGGCAVYSDAPYATTYSNGIYSGGYTSSGVIVTSPPVITTYPAYPYNGYNGYNRYNRPYHTPPVYTPRPPTFNRPPAHFQNQFNTPNYSRPGYNGSSNHDNRRGDRHP